MRRSKKLLTGTYFTLACIALFVINPAVALAGGGPAHTETVAAGPYVVDVNLYQDPPFTDQSVEVTVVPHDSRLRLTGRIVMTPGLGTDAVVLHAPLSPMGQTSTLVGAIRMPVRGAWNIVIQLHAPQGSVEATFPLLVAAPRAIPIWLGLPLSLAPLTGFALFICPQYRYHQKLLPRPER